MSHRLRLFGFVLVVGLLIVYGRGGLSRDYDIVAMTRKIHQATAEIGLVNASILNSLSAVGDEVQKVDAVKARLEVMDGLVDDQVIALEQLAAQTGHQAELSRQLQELTATLAPPVDRLARSAAKEADVLEIMSDSTADLALSLRAIASINQSIAQKMWRAEELAALVLSRMP